MSDRKEFQPARVAGLVKRHETRQERAIRREVFESLLDDWEYGDCPGSKLKVGNQEIWLFTRENVRLWLRTKAREIGSKETP
jgi:hypothetical protein